MSKGIIVSGFPAVGKSFLPDNSKGVNIIDSDSSKYSWVKDSDGNNTKERNPNFPSNYIQHIKKMKTYADIILVSSHKEVINSLIEEDLDFTIVRPHIDCKDEWIRRLEQRGSTQGFIDLISKNWDTWLIELEDFNFEHNLIREIILNENDYLIDKLKLILVYTKGYDNND